MWAVWLVTVTKHVQKQLKKRKVGFESCFLGISVLNMKQGGGWVTGSLVARVGSFSSSHCDWPGSWGYRLEPELGTNLKGLPIMNSFYQTSPTSERFHNFAKCYHPVWLSNSMAKLLWSLSHIQITTISATWEDSEGGGGDAPRTLPLQPSFCVKNEHSWRQRTHLDTAFCSNFHIHPHVPNCVILWLLMQRKKASCTQGTYHSEREVCTCHPMDHSVFYEIRWLQMALPHGENTDTA